MDRLVTVDKVLSNYNMNLYKYAYCRNGATDGTWSIIP